jgi:DNA polymerase III subunit epsilon
MILDRPIAFFDLESTGKDPVKDRIVEFGAAVLNTDWTLGTQWVQRFNPGFPIPAEATAVHGIADADVADCPPFSHWAPKIWSAFRGKDIGGYNVRRFDLPMLDEELRRCRLRLDLTGVRIVDVFGIYSQKRPRRLADAYREFCGKELEGAHGAAADGSAALEVFLGEMRAFPDLDAMNLEDIAAFSKADDREYVDLGRKLYRDADGDVCYAFGKHRDKKVRVIEQEERSRGERQTFTEWMFSPLRSFPSSTLEALNAELDRCFPGVLS